MAKVKRDRRRVTLKGLPDTTRDVRASPAYSVAEALGYVRHGGAVTAAGPNGALNVWTDDAGQWRMTFCRHRETVDLSAARFVTKVQAWLQKWWPELGR